MDIRTIIETYFKFGAILGIYICFLNLYNIRYSPDLISFGYYESNEDNQIIEKNIRSIKRKLYLTSVLKGLCTSLAYPFIFIDLVFNRFETFDKYIIP